MQTRKTTVRSNQKGWVVYFDDNQAEFYPFTSTEPERLISFLCKEVAGISVDHVVTHRQLELVTKTQQLEAQQRSKPC